MVRHLLVAATTTLLSVVAAVQGAPDTSNKAVGLLTCHHGERGVCLSGTPLLLRPDDGGGGSHHPNSFTSTTADECCALCRKYSLRTPPIPTPCASFTFNETDKHCDLYAPSAHIEKTYSTECTSGGPAAVDFDILRSSSTPKAALATKYTTLSRELGPDPSTARLLPIAAVAHRALQDPSKTPVDCSIPGLLDYLIQDNPGMTVSSICAIMRSGMCTPYTVPSRCSSSSYYPPPPPRSNRCSSWGSHMHEVPPDGHHTSHLVWCACDQGFYSFLPEGTLLAKGRDVCFRCSGFPHMQSQGTSCNCAPGYYKNIPEYTKISCPLTMTRAGDDSCQYANDGTCDDYLGGYCATGTDATDCGHTTTRVMATHCCLPCTRFPNKHEIGSGSSRRCVCDNGFPLYMEGGCKKCSEIPHARGTTTCSCAPGYFWNKAGDECVIEDTCPGPSYFGPYKDCAAINATKCSPGMLKDLQDPTLCAKLYKTSDGHSLTHEECVVHKQLCPSTCPKERINTKGKCDQGISCSWGTDVDDCYNSRCPDASHMDGSKCKCDSNAKMNIANAAPMTCDRDCKGHYSACTLKCESALQRKWITTATSAGHGLSCAAAQTLVPDQRKSCKDGDGQCFTRAVTCNGHGDPKSDGSCTCDTDYFGVHCLVKYTRKETCNGHGDPKSDGSCTCDTDYFGVHCLVKYTRKETCNGHGDPKSDGSCTCDAYYFGSHCAQKYTRNKTCNDHGDARPDGGCACDKSPDTYYFGSDCANSYTRKETCNGHGDPKESDYSDPGNCHCDPEYTTPDCSERCEKWDSAGTCVCSKRGDGSTGSYDEDCPTDAHMGIIAIGVVLVAVLTYLTRKQPCISKQTSRRIGVSAETEGGLQTTLSRQEPTGVTVETSNPTSLAEAEYLGYSLN
eukprot:COSAG01_NODE_2627_length_7352_cov_8.028126_2_plen_902_part_00